MKLSEIIKELALTIQSAAGRLDREVTGGYASDLLSDVMAHSKEGDIWVTIQGHPNVVAIATLRDLAGIILANGRQPDAETVQRAEEEGVPILCTLLPTFDVVGRLHRLGIHGKD
ncbi:MAG: serine kinase [Deltaproteobacteria bacterium RBG_16_54_18]|nr:MAG: serine kinase [Deltaproteobacteria bacterium RBG_16_54_18]